MKSQSSSLPLFVVISLISLGGFGSRTAQAQQASERILYSFSADPSGQNPQDYGALVMDAAGNLYGTTWAGGISYSYCYYGCGTVFELVSSGGSYSPRVLYSFVGGGDGAGPLSGLIIDGSGNLYGTTWSGGGSNYGTVYELTASDTEGVLHSFTGFGGDGGQPAAPLLMDAAGNLYGTTRSNGVYGYGMVFELLNSGGGTYNERVLYNFTGGADGAWPYSGLIIDQMGNLYGTTSAGGFSTGQSGYGTVFELVNTSGTYSPNILHTFSNTPGDGLVSYSGLTVDPAGNLYGTTVSGGTNNVGTAFELVCSNGTWPCSGTYSWRQLYSFTGNNTDGASPYASLTADAAGNLYGTNYTRGGPGGTGYGTVFELVCSAGNWPCSGTYSEKVLYGFTGSAGDGRNPESGVIMDASGNLYGTTMNGGADGYGTVYEIVNSGTVSLTSSPNPSTYGQAVTLTATVGSTFGNTKTQSTRRDAKTPVSSGTVTWSSNTGCSPSMVSENTATCTTSILPAGDPSVSATYLGTTQSITTQVNQATPSINISSVTPSSETYGQDSPVTITAVLSWSGNGTPPTASDVVIAGNGRGTYSPVSCGAPSGNTSTCTASYTPTTADAVGTYTETASFTGDSNYAASNVALSTFAITSAGSGSISVASNQNPSTSGQSVTFTATIPGQYGAITRKGTAKSPDVTGTVTWSSNTGCGTTAVTSGMPGTATCTTSSLLVGSDTVTANYSGDANHTAGSGSMTQTVNQGTSSTVVMSSLDPSQYGQSVSFAATVTGTNPTGTVQFNIDGGAFGAPVTLASGMAASGSISTLTTGTHTVTAVYSGDTANAGSTGTLSGGQVVQSASSTVVVSTSNGQSTYGQSVSFTATINGTNGLLKKKIAGAKSPDVTGTVTWSSNTGCGSSSVTGGNPGTATCTTSTLPVGNSYAVTANYSGDSNHNSGSGSVDQTVTQGATSINVSSVSPSSEAYGQDAPVTITAVLSWTGSGAAPAASSVTLGGNGNGTYGPTSCGSPSGDAITCTATYTPSTADNAGTYTETATFSGDSNYSGSTSSQSGNFVIGNASSTVSVVSSVNPSTYGQAVTFTASISGQFGNVNQRVAHKASVRSPDVTGTVTWSANTGCGTTTVASGGAGNPGTATCTTSNLGVGNDAITATYSGDGNHSGGTGSLSGGQTVNQATTSTAVTSSSNPVGLGQPVTFTATVSGQYGGTPTGTVTFYSGTTSLGSSTLAGGAGSLTYTFQTGGTRSITAVYSGDSNFTTSTSPVLSQSVTKATSTTSLTSSLNPSVYGQAVTFTATVSSSMGAPPNGETVTFKLGTSILGTATTKGGVATFTTSTLNVGTRNVKANYSGDSKRTASTSSAVAQVVSKATTTSAITSSQNPSSSGQAVTFTVTVSGEYGGTPTGTITFTDNGTSLGTATLSGGTATLTTSSLTTGKHTIKASYGGDPDFRTSWTGLSQTVN